MNVEQMKAKTTSQAAEIGQKSDAIDQPQARARRKTAALRWRSKPRQGQLADEVRTLENELAARTGVLQGDRRRAGKRRPNSPGSPPISSRTLTSSDTQRAELAASLQAQAALTAADHVGGYDKRGTNCASALSSKTAEAEAVRQRSSPQTRPGEAGRPRRRTRASAHRADRSRRTLWRAASRSSAPSSRQSGRFLTDYENASDRLRTEAMSAQRERVRASR